MKSIYLSACENGQRSSLSNGDIRLVTVILRTSWLAEYRELCNETSSLVPVLCNWAVLVEQVWKLSNILRTYVFGDCVLFCFHFTNYPMGSSNSCYSIRVLCFQEYFHYFLAFLRASFDSFKSFPVLSNVVFRRGVFFDLLSSMNIIC